MRDKADFYNWLMKQHDETHSKMTNVPKISLDEQSKTSNMIEYTPENQSKVDNFKKLLKKIEETALDIQK